LIFLINNLDKLVKTAKVPIESHHYRHIIDSGPQQKCVLDGAALDLYGLESFLSPGY
jgi:hypothetical protein